MPSDSDGGTVSNPPSGGGTPPTGRTANNPAGHGGHGFGRGGRRGNQGGRGGPPRRGQQQLHFKGREPMLKGFIYDSTGERNPDQFIKTTKEIINYVGRTYTKYTSKFTEAVKDLELIDPVPPANPDPAQVLQFEVWKLDIKEHRIKAQEYSNFQAGLYNVVFGQCTEALQDRLKSHQDYPAASQDGIALLCIIKTLTYTFEERRKLSDALAEVKEQFYTFKQGKKMSLQWYHELFLGQVEVLDKVGITIADESLVTAIANVNG